MPECSEIVKGNMMIKQETLQIRTRGRGTYEITDRIEQAANESGINTGLCHVFIQHTSASLILCENADPSVRRDLETFMARLIPDGDPMFHHTQEGPDDMPAHLRSILTKMDLTLPVSNGRCALGTWQGIYLWEHRTQPHHRRVVVTLQGE
jgi:secondary thiamine-phosphate synthase enzyme